MADAMFDRQAVQAFRFVRCEFLADSGEARLVYAFDDGPELVETMYPQLPRWREIQARLDPAGRMRSDLSRRLGLVS